MFTKYSVMVEPFAEHHFIKKFKKKYRNSWDASWRGIIEGFKRINDLTKTSVANIIIEKDNIKIVKTEFRIAGTKQSRKSSGNRCIVVVQEDIKMVYVLLVYHKNDLGNDNETSKWKKIVKENYKQYKEYL